jgi:hypothetical protein
MDLAPHINICRVTANSRMHLAVPSPTVSLPQAQPCHCAFLVSFGAALADGFAAAFRFLGFAAGPVAAFQNNPAANAPASGATQNTEMCCMRLWPCIQTLCVTQVH